MSESGRITVNDLAVTSLNLLARPKYEDERKYPALVIYTADSLINIILFPDLSYDINDDADNIMEMTHLSYDQVVNFIDSLSNIVTISVHNYLDEMAPQNQGAIIYRCAGDSCVNAFGDYDIAY